VDIIEKIRIPLERKKQMRNKKQSEKVTKIRQNDLFFCLPKLFFLYEGEKKIGKATPLLSQLFFSKGKFFSEKLKKNDKAAEKALNNKEALNGRTPLNPLTFNRDNSDEFHLRRVIIPKKRIGSCERQKPEELLFIDEYTTTSIFCVK